MVWAHVKLHSEGPQQWTVLGMECVQTEVDGGHVLFARGNRRCVVLEYAAETKLTLRLLVSGMTSVVLPLQPALLLYTGRTGELHSESLTTTAWMPISRQVRMTRTAISPRLATRTFLMGPVLTVLERVSDVGV